MGVTDIEVKGAHGVRVKADVLLEEFDASSYDAVLLPGGWAGTLQLATHAKVQALLQAFDKAHKIVGAICAAPYVLDKAGILQGEFTCYPSIEEKISHGTFTNRAEVIEAAHIRTSQGPATAMCFALSIVRTFAGEAVEASVREELLAKC